MDGGPCHEYSRPKPGKRLIKQIWDSADERRQRQLLAAFLYDDLNRLTSYKPRHAQFGHTSITTDYYSPGSSQSWDLDAVGNQTCVTTDGTAKDNTVNDQNQLTANGSSDLAYDKRGNSGSTPTTLTCVIKCQRYPHMEPDGPDVLHAGGRVLYRDRRDP